MKILDCTLRDGGYYTSWDFSKPLVKRYLKALEASKIDIVELGLRNFPKDQFLGAHAYTTDEFINSLDVPDSLEIAVMVDAKTILSYSGSTEEAVSILFASKSESPVDIVRVASHFGEVESCEEIIKSLKELGYQVGLNLMQSGGRPSEELAQVATKISEWQTVDVLYFADSLGNMGAEEVLRIKDALSSAWSGMMGIHTHNNQGKGLANSLTAISNGVEWIDSTVLGMGRGAGNTETELLTLELENIGYQYRSMPLWNLVLDDFQPLKLKHGWGASLLYHFAANHGIHPTYVQNLLGDSKYTSEQIIQALTHLAPLKTSSYKASLLNEGVSGIKSQISTVVGGWNASDWCKDKEIMIVGAGKSVTEYSSAIELFIQKRHPVTLSLNIHNELKDNLIDGFVAIDPMRLMLEVSDYELKGKVLYTSLSSLPSEIRYKLSSLEVKDFGYNLETGKFIADKTNCTIPKLLSLAYTLCLAKTGGASKIWLVGFDGYQAGDKRQEEMIELLDAIRDANFDIPCVCLTPSTYPITQGSIYAPY